MDLNVQEEWMNILMRTKTISNETVQEIREVGSGSFGTVYLGKWQGLDVAVKRIKSSAFSGNPSIAERLKLEFLEESKILARLTHVNVVQLYGVIQDGPGGTLGTVTEFIKDGTLREVLLTKSGVLGRHQRLCLATDVADAMEHIHSKKIVHFDLKSANIFVDMTNPLRPICKVGDLGLSKINQHALMSSGIRGTLPWMAPELLDGTKNYVSEKVDVYSFGVVLWEILTSEVPYAGMDAKTIKEGVAKHTLRPLVPSSCDPELTELMEQCWASDRWARPSFTDIARRLHSMTNQDTTSISGGAWRVNMDTFPVIKNKDVQEVRELPLHGNVYQGKWREWNVAVKRMNTIRSLEGERREYLQHAKILANLNHRNVVKFCGVIQDGPGGSPAIVTEYLDGPLREVLGSKNWDISHHQRLHIAADVAAGMEYLDRMKLQQFYFDMDCIFINMENPSRPTCKLGLLRKAYDLCIDLKGTLPWMTPEELINSKRNESSKKNNVHSYGDFLWEVLNGKNPRAEAERVNKLNPPIPSSCDPQWKKLMEDCWSGEPSFTMIVRRLKIMFRAAGLSGFPSSTDSSSVSVDGHGHNRRNDVHKKPNESISDVYGMRASFSSEQQGCNIHDDSHKKYSVSDIHGIKTSIKADEHGCNSQNDRHKQTTPSVSDIYRVETSISIGNDQERATKFSASNIFGIEASASDVHNDEVDRHQKQSESDIYKIESSFASTTAL